MSFESLPDVVTVPQLAEYLQISTLTVQRALKCGKLNGFKVGNGWRIEKTEVKKWLNLEE